jgi:SAM-dependent methyltransferase
LLPFGVDISDIAIEKARTRLADIPGSKQRLLVLDSQQLPFEDDFFSLVTCFDMLEHLDEGDIQTTWAEIQRVLRPRGTILSSVSCRPAGVEDKFGDNLHRTVRSVDWWIQQLQPDRVEFDVARSQLKIWKRAIPSRQEPAAVDSKGTLTGEPKSNSTDTASLYQKIYDENSWYGNAELDRCPGVRLLPHFVDWLEGPVLDLGCGRGHTVEHLQDLGFAADGIDQISCHAEMLVGDITKPIQDIQKYSSVVCMDCIEHLYDEQLEGLFDNMKNVKRQAFSIHNGESNGTGVELHVNRLSFVEWSERIRKHFDIAAAIQISPEQMLYLTRSRTQP